MALDQERPIGARGLHLEIDETIAHQALVVADGTRFVQVGAASGREGRKRLYWNDFGFVDYSQPPVPPERARMQALPPRGYSPLRDPYLYSAPGGAPGTEVLRHVYKAGGAIYIDKELLGSMDTAERARMQQYDGQVIIVDGASRPVLVRRKLDAEQSAGQPMRYEMTRLGIRFPTTDTKPTTSASGGGTINPVQDPYVTEQIYRVRLTAKDKYGRTSNPTLPSSDLTILAVSQNQRITIDWTSVEATLPSDATEVELWIQMAIQGLASSFVRIPEIAGTGKFLRSDPAYTSTFILSTLQNADTWPTLETVHGFDHGHPPRLHDFAIVNGKMVAIPVEDVVYRERTGKGEYVSRQATQRGTGTDTERGRRTEQGAGLRNTRMPADITFESSGSKIEPVQVDRTRIFIGKVFSPDYLEDFFTLTGGDERGVGVSKIGDTAFVFTTRTVYAVDPINVTSKATFSAIGADPNGRDSIVWTRDGIQFLGSDGAFYLFDGARSHPIANPIAPLFRRDDYEGYYRRFDRTRASEIQSAFARERTYFIMPTKDEQGQTTTEKALVVADSTWTEGSPPLYSIDLGCPYTILSPLSEDGPLLGIDELGYFFLVDEGTVDEGQDAGDSPIAFFQKYRKVSGNKAQLAIWTAFSIDLDAAGQALEAMVEIDDNPSLSKTYSIPAVQGRQRFGPKSLPAIFRGRYASCSIRGLCSKRPHIYGVDIESRPMGRFS